MSIKLLSFKNSAHRLANGNCCDPLCRSCDNYFLVCISSSNSSTSCPHPQLWTVEYNSDNIVFGNKIEDVDYQIHGNPLEIKF